MQEILSKALSSHDLKEAEIFELLNMSDPRPLFAAADAVRKEYAGDAVQLRGLIEFSNMCKQNCLYCGLRRDNKNASRYRLTPAEITDMAGRAKEYGYKTVVLQSGEDPWYDAGKMAEIIKGIKNLGLALTLSIGEKTFDEYKSYRDAGADRYLLRIETTDSALYHKLNPGMSLDNRMKCLENLKALGYELGSGIMVGLPGQTFESIAKDILFLKKIEVDMAGIGPFIYNPETPIEKPGGDAFELALKVMAVLRLLMPGINIPATTAMETLRPNGRLEALKSGANVVMPNVTEREYRKFYELYPGKICTDETPGVCRVCIENKIKSIGRTIGQTHGSSRENKRS